MVVETSGASLDPRESISELLGTQKHTPIHVHVHKDVILSLEDSPLRHCSDKTLFFSLHGHMMSKGMEEKGTLVRFSTGAFFLMRSRKDFFPWATIEYPGICIN